MELQIHVEARPDHYVATARNLPGVQGIGPDEATAVARLTRALSSAYDRIPPSPFAAVRKRLEERAAGI